MTAKESAWLLAENLFHEAVHHFVNCTLLTSRIMADEYDARESKRINIPWRSGPSGLCETWELDRVLHAAAVYSAVLRWRAEALGNSDISDWERNAFRAASVDGERALSILLEALQQNIDSFDHGGIEIINRLVESSGELLRSSVDLSCQVH